MALGHYDFPASCCWQEMWKWSLACWKSDNSCWSMDGTERFCKSLLEFQSDLLFQVGGREFRPWKIATIAADVGQLEDWSRWKVVVAHVPNIVFEYIDAHACAISRLERMLGNIGQQCSEPIPRGALSIGRLGAPNKELATLSCNAEK